MADTKEETYECFGGGPSDGKRLPNAGMMDAIHMQIDNRTGKQHYYRLVNNTNANEPTRPEIYYQYEGDDIDALMARMLKANPHVFDKE